MTYPSLSGSVYGVVLNDHGSLKALSPFEGAPYQQAPKAPILYIKPRNTWTTPGDVCVLPQDQTSIEIAATIGLVFDRPLIHARSGDVFSAIKGWFLAADLSLPHDSYYRPAIKEKCQDHSLVMGEIQTLTSFDALASLVISTQINKTERQSQRCLSDLIRDPEQLIVDVTDFMSLTTEDALLVGVEYQAIQGKQGDRVDISTNTGVNISFSLGQEGAR